jgi:hypothetical protein
MSIPRWKMTVLLAALLLLLVVHPLISADAKLLSLLFCLLFLVVVGAAFIVLSERRSSRLGAVILGIPACGGIVANNFLSPPSPRLETAFFDLLPILFLGYTVAVIVRSIFLEAEVTLDTINGALCGYLLIGLLFGNLFGLIERLWPGSFDFRDVSSSLVAAGGEQRSLLRYFSLVTLTTLGYGDITPHSPAARTLAWLEAMAGQFYVAVIIAGIVAIRVSAALRPREKTTP